MEQALSFEGTGLDLDNNYSTFSPGDSPFRLNCRYGTTERSDLGGIQNFKGNTLLTMSFEGGFFIQPPGENEVIGSCKDPERDAIIYFVWNSNMQHQIRRYWTATRKIQLILESPVLNFQRSHKITSANVVNNTLSWTDGWVDDINPFNYNGPRLIDIDKAYNFMLNNPWPLGYTTIDVQTISMIKYAPSLCPTFQYENDLNFNDNRLYGHLFQFGYRYVYYDNSKSVISPLSKLTQPQGEDIEGNYDLTTENRLDITIETGHYTVVRIELVALEGTSYKVVDVIEKYGPVPIPSDSTYTIEFFNTKFIAEIPLEEALRPFDYVPQVALTQEVVSSNQGARMLYGNFIEGYDNVADFKLIGDSYIEKIEPGDHNFKRISFKRRGSYQIGVVYADITGRKSFVQTTAEAVVAIPDWYNLDLISQYYDSADEWILSSCQKMFINWEIKSPPPAWATHYQVVCTRDIQNQQRLFTFQCFGAALGDKKGNKWGMGTETLSIPPQIGYDFQQGDRIRMLAVYDGSLNFNVPDFEMIGFGVQTNPKKLGQNTPLITISDPFQIQISDLPFDYPIKNFNPAQQTIELQVSANAPFINQKHLYIFQIYNPNTEIAEDNQLFFETGNAYPIVNGQHSVPSGVIDGMDIFMTNNKYELNPQAYRYQVTQFDERLADGQIGEIRIASKFSNVVGVAPSHADIRQYVFASGFASAYENIQNSQSSNSGTVDGSLDRPPSLSGSNTTYILAAGYQWTFGTFLVNIFPTTGECAGIQQANDETRLTITSPCRKFDILGVPLETHTYSPFYPSTIDQSSRPYIINKEAVRRQYVADIRNGGPVFDNTQINFFSRFVFDDLTKLNERYNEITRMQEVGFMLKVRQRNKSTSIYIGRTEITNADGSGNLASVNRILGTINPSDEVYGGTNGTTDVKSIRDTYFFDYINGVVVRDATNGLVAISGNLSSPQDPYKMTAFFRDMAQYISENLDTTEVHSGWDNNTQSYYFTLRKLRKEDTVPQFISKYKLEEAWDSGLTLSFHETSNRWQTFHSFVPEHYASIGNNFLCFLNGEAWLSYSNEVRNSYFDTTHPTVTAQICNQNTNNIKVFDNIDVYSNRKWSCPELDDIFILPNAQFINGMRSKLEDVHFIGKEGKWHASFLRDINTPGYTNTLLSLMGGRRLRGDAMKTTLRNNDTTEVFLRQVIFHFTLSEMSG
jgi:hypothetical protein